MQKDAGMMMTLLVLVAFVALGIAVMLTTANALLQPIPVKRSELETRSDSPFRHRAA